MTTFLPLLTLYSVHILNYFLFILFFCPPFFLSPCILFPSCGEKVNYKIHKSKKRRTVSAPDSLSLFPVPDGTKIRWIQIKGKETKSRREQKWKEKKKI